MEHLKDDKKSSQLSSFIESQSVRFNIFGENRVADRAYRRAERIAAGIYLLTNHVSHSEPLRDTLRRDAVALVDGILGIRNELRTSESLGVEAVRATIRGTISRLKLLALAGYVSTQNSNAVTEALDELGQFLEMSQRSPFAENLSISRDELINVRDPHYVSILNIKDKKNIKDVNAISDKGGLSDRPLDDQSMASLSTIAPHTLERREMVLDALETYATSHGMGSSMNIRDIAMALPEYSEKMIQRELAELVQQNKVKKTGTKRWSRYSFVN